MGALRTAFFAMGFEVDFGAGFDVDFASLGAAFAVVFLALFRFDFDDTDVEGEVDWAARLPGDSIATHSASKPVSITGPPKAAT